MTESADHTARSVLQLVLVAALIEIAYTCSHCLRFTSEWLNFIFACVFYAIPFLAVRPVLRLRHKARIWGLALLLPLVSLPSCGLLGTVACDRPGSAMKLEDQVKTFQFGASTVKFERYENGGAVGVHGFFLEQRRLIVPGLYLVKSIDFFDSAYAATITVEGPWKVRVIAKGNYYSNDYRADRTYTLKPWVYF